MKEPVLALLAALPHLHLLTAWGRESRTSPRTLEQTFSKEEAAAVHVRNDLISKRDEHL